jgi:hypothetical protein
LSGCYFVQIQTQVIEDTFKMSKFKKSGNLLKCSVQHSTWGRCSILKRES